MTEAEAQVKYATTNDGVRIAYTVDGAGPATPLLVAQAPPISHVRESYWEGLQEYQGLAESRRTAILDFRGCGLSDRNIADVSMDALELDLHAVIERLGWSRFALHGSGMSGPVVMKYAAEHPERVTSLILRETYARGAEMGRIPRMRALGALLREDWDSYLTMMTVTIAGWNERNARLKELLDGTTTPELTRMYAAATPTYDATAFVDQITTRTLVIGRDDMPVPSGDMLRQLGAQIRDARVVLVRGFIGGAARHAVEQFLVEADNVPAIDKAPLGSGTAVILFADVADSTALTERLGDAAFREKARELDEALRRVITSNGGTAIEGKLLGDGVLATFGAAREAIASAQELHRSAAAVELALHVGIHAGDVLREEGNVYGGAVNIASRISSEAAAGETLVSGTVRELARTSAGVSFEDRGERALKGIEEPVRVWAVRSEG